MTARTAGLITVLAVVAAVYLANLVLPGWLAVVTAVIVGAVVLEVLRRVAIRRDGG